MNIYFRSLLALAADAAFVISVGFESASLLVDELGMALSKKAGVEWVGGRR